MIFLLGRQKSGAAMLSLQRIMEIRTYKTVRVMGHKISQAMAERDANYKLAGLIELDGPDGGGPEPGERGTWRYGEIQSRGGGGNSRT